MIDCEQLDIKHEEDPLLVTKIRNESQELKNEIKLEPQDSDNAEYIFDVYEQDHIDIKSEVQTYPDSHNKLEGEVVKKSLAVLSEGHRNKLCNKLESTEYQSGAVPLVYRPCEIFQRKLYEEDSDKISGKIWTYNGCKTSQNNKLIGSMYIVQSTEKLKVCEKSCSQKTNLVEHSHKQIVKDVNYSCNICNTSFPEEFQLNEHMHVHAGPKILTCSVCSKPFSWKSHLNEHMRVHTFEKPFSCEICGKPFGRKSHLNEHARTHTDEKPFTCNVCSRSFSWRSNLNVHMRTHTDEKLFKCNICNKSFGWKYNLAGHMRIHTDEKPFKCNICGKLFSWKSNLNVHIRKHTNNEISTFS